MAKCFGIAVERKVFGLLLGVLVFSGYSWGQALSTLNGSVTDPSGAVVPGAQIVATETETGLTRTAVSSADGLYVLPELRPTSYALSVSAQGFRHYTQNGITLQANDAITVNVKLEIGAASETVTVEATATQIDTTTATLKQVVDSTRMVELPLNGRNPAQLTTLVAGAVTAPGNDADEGATKTFPVAVTVSTNGTRSNQISYQLDGVPNTDFLSNVNFPFPMPDALQEFSVQTSNYAAEYGQNAGGVVNIVTKSGTNGFHGDVFGYLRNAVFNARNFFAAQPDPLKRSQFGGTIGGPVLRDRAFFFFGYQGTRIRSQQQGLSAYVPTNANISGDFSSLLSASNPGNPQGRAISLKDPNGGVFPNNQIPISQLDPAALALTDGWLPRTAANGRILYSTPIIQNLDEYTTRKTTISRRTTGWRSDTLETRSISPAI